ncbi:MAG TPA: DUF1993 family protein, partial [Turneriella sp.]|nr:DUF1993 family protein [Turneriella sp.]
MMSAWLIGGADAIQSDIEPQLDDTQSYKKLDLDEKLALFLTTAAKNLAAALNTSFESLRPFITDYISVGASIYERHHTMDVSKKASMLGLSDIELHSIDLGGASIPAALETAQRLCTQGDRLVLIAGAEVPRYEDTEQSFDELRARIAKTIAFVESFAPEQFAGAEERPIALRTESRSRAAVIAMMSGAGRIPPSAAARSMPRASGSPRSSNTRSIGASVAAAPVACRSASCAVR